jgi:Zn-dependent peptidase ImmA (M78 family)
VLVTDAAREAAATVLEDVWKLGFPVDPIAIAERLGMRVEAASFIDEDMAGAIIAKGPEDVTLLYAEGDILGRQVFTVAHELGHYFERLAKEDEEFSFVEKRHPEQYDLHEFFADEFAGNLLMPEPVFAQLWRDGLSVRDLARYFGVTQSAAQKRAERLKKYGALA